MQQELSNWCAQLLTCNRCTCMHHAITFITLSVRVFHGLFYHAKHYICMFAPQQCLNQARDLPQGGGIMLKLISYFSNSFLAVTRRHALNVVLETNQPLYLQQLCTRPCTNLMAYKEETVTALWKHMLPLPTFSNRPCMWRNSTCMWGKGKGKCTSSNCQNHTNI